MGNDRKSPSITGVATSLSLRIAHEVLNPAAEVLSDSAAVVLSSVLAIIFGAVSLVAKRARFIGYSYLLLYSVNLVQTWQRISIRESERDREGLILMEQAGYDIREVPRYWEEQITLGKKLFAECIKMDPFGAVGPVRFLP
jgi:hypothetical protein